MEGWVVPKGKRKIKMNKHCDYKTDFFKTDFFIEIQCVGRQAYACGQNG